MKKIFLFIFVSILVLISLMMCSTPKKSKDTRTKLQWDGKIINSIENFSDSIITCTGDVIIIGGGSLTLENVLLYMCGSIYGIYVEAGGELIIKDNSTITVQNPGSDYYQFWYKEGSSGKIENSTVEYTWTPDPGGNSQFNEAGIFCETDNFEISNSTIKFSLGNGIETFQSNNLSIIDSIFSENGANGILVRNSTGLSITGCTITGNGTNINRNDGCGMIVLVVTGLIDNCNIELNRLTGFEGSGDMDITISNCGVKNNGDFGIFVHDEFSTSLASITNNIIQNNSGSSQACAGLSVEGAVKASVHHNNLDQNYIGIRVLNNTEITNFEYNTITNCNAWGIHIDNSSPVFYRNTVSGCNRVAFIQEENGQPNPNFGDTTIQNSGYNDFSNNTNGIRNDSTNVFKAENNYWGTTDSNNINLYNFADDTSIDYDPWLNSPP